MTAALLPVPNVGQTANPLEPVSVEPLLSSPPSPRVPVSGSLKAISVSELLVTELAAAIGQLSTSNDHCELVLAAIDELRTAAPNSHMVLASESEDDLSLSSSGSDDDPSDGDLSLSGSSEDLGDEDLGDEDQTKQEDALCFKEGDYVQAGVVEDEETQQFFNPPRDYPYYWQIVEFDAADTQLPYLVERGLDGVSVWCSDSQLRLAEAPDFEAMESATIVTVGSRKRRRNAPQPTARRKQNRRVTGVQCQGADQQTVVSLVGEVPVVSLLAKPVVEVAQPAVGTGGNTPVLVFVRTGGVFGKADKTADNLFKAVASKVYGKSLSNPLEMKISDFRSAPTGGDDADDWTEPAPASVARETFKKMIVEASKYIKPNATHINLYTIKTSPYHLDMRLVKDSNDLANILTTDPAKLRHIKVPLSGFAAVVSVLAPHDQDGTTNRLKQDLLVDADDVGIVEILKQQGDNGANAKRREASWDGDDGQQMSAVNHDDDDAALDELIDTIQTKAEGRGALARIFSSSYGYNSLNKKQRKRLFKYWVDCHDDEAAAIAALNKQIAEAGDDQEAGVKKLLTKNGDDFADPITGLPVLKELFADETEDGGQLDFPRKLDETQTGEAALDPVQQAELQVLQGLSAALQGLSAAPNAAEPKQQIDFEQVFKQEAALNARIAALKEEDTGFRQRLEAAKAKLLRDAGL